MRGQAQATGSAPKINHIQVTVRCADGQHPGLVVAHGGTLQLIARPNERVAPSIFIMHFVALFSRIF